MLKTPQLFLHEQVFLVLITTFVMFINNSVFEVLSIQNNEITTLSKEEGLYTQIHTDTNILYTVLYMHRLLDNMDEGAGSKACVMMRNTDLSRRGLQLWFVCFSKLYHHI